MEFNSLLHKLRTRELVRLPAGAVTVLHGGSAGPWYFEWFAESYPTPVRRHIAVDVFNARPDELGPEVEWLQRSLGDLAPVGDQEVDLVFAGQVIEHLWPEEVVGFLLEASRVLRPGGVLALDSPNRRVTTALGWHHPEHTIEFRPDEIVELLEFAGFGGSLVRGVWLCFDSVEQRFLSLEGAPPDARWTTDLRARAAEARPDDSFVWWAEAVRDYSNVDEERLKRRTGEIYNDYRRYRLGRVQHNVGSESGVGVDSIVSAERGDFGYLIFGPYVPMRPGCWVARYRAAAGSGAASADDVLGVADVSIGGNARIIALREITSRMLPPDGRLREIVLPFELDQAEFGVEFRLRTTGVTPLAAVSHVVVEHP